MRITTAMMFANATRNITKSQEKYLLAQEPLITQRSINRPSDDPIGAARVLGIHKQIGQIDQYQRNIDQAENFINQTEQALGSVRDSLIRLQEIAVGINDGMAGPGEYAAVAKEVDALYDAILSAANSKISNRYVFAGFETTNAPFDTSGNYLGGIGDEIEIEINNGDFLVINQTGDEVFKGPMDVFQVVTDMRDAIAAGDQDAITANLTPLADALDQILAFTSDIGAKSNRLESARTNNDELTQAYTNIMSNIEDADVVAATAEFAQMEQIYQATLTVSSRVMNQSFLDFLQ